MSAAAAFVIGDKVGYLRCRSDRSYAHEGMVLAVYPNGITSHGHPMVKIEGKSGLVAASHCKLLAAAENSWSEKNPRRGVCRRCGCTDANACYKGDATAGLGGACFWANDEQTLCSECDVPRVEKVPVQGGRKQMTICPSEGHVPTRVLGVLARLELGPSCRLNELMEAQFETTVPGLVHSEVHRMFMGEGVSVRVANRTAAALARAKKASADKPNGGGMSGRPDKDCPRGDGPMIKAGRGYRCAKHGKYNAILKQIEKETAESPE